MRQHGLNQDSLSNIFKAKVLSRLTYAAPAWWGFANQSTVNQLEGFLRKAIKYNYYSSTEPNFTEIINKIEISLFNKITENE